MRRGELWWAEIDGKRPVVVLSDEARSEVHVMQIVAPATSAEKRGFLIMSGDQAVDADNRRRMVAEAGQVQAIGIEVWFGSSEGLAEEGVVRVALPQNATVFCTWGTRLGEELLVERIGACSPEKLRELDAAIQLAGP
ncbi:type II toxin-antitoxin system PemK/MazF family toxin [Nocardioides sp. zg-1228]|uniref:type II toxin-antitoxin system PemK/MazF family toxin n=1 Tax=Nocardioides sp. zg-1228 TaxID=2763008 RepID=UPI0016429CF6|nr:type II toxin-antitoxin system PemK/MazF family toxin [Nocardioides sp. zg-1228]MBC2934016.1 type II toxin-antitoxin system PemK/MazF family toxin [Nocardioides sp. zg-1228]QSF58772.1 type II toxin-antitoxin system PemK/MazF family toxin [Nocardioides sp. zg-1228]